VGTLTTFNQGGWSAGTGAATNLFDYSQQAGTSNIAQYFAGSPSLLNQAHATMWSALGGDPYADLYTDPRNLVWTIGSFNGRG